MGSLCQTSTIQGDEIGVLFDADAGTLSFFKNNVAVGTLHGLPSIPLFPVVSSTAVSCRVFFKHLYSSGAGKQTLRQIKILKSSFDPFVQGMEMVCAILPLPFC